MKNMYKDGKKTDIKRNNKKTSNKKRNPCKNGCKWIWQSDNDMLDENDESIIETCSMCSYCLRIKLELA